MNEVVVAEVVLGRSLGLYPCARVAEKRERKVKWGSIYDPLIDQFLESGHDLVEI